MLAETDDVLVFLDALSFSWIFYVLLSQFKLARIRIVSFSFILKKPLGYADPI